jgi:hypothetical protein
VGARAQARKLKTASAEWAVNPARVELAKAQQAQQAQQARQAQAQQAQGHKGAQQGPQAKQ